MFTEGLDFATEETSGLEQTRFWVGTDDFDGFTARRVIRVNIPYLTVLCAREGSVNFRW